MPTTGHLIRAARKAAGMSQNELGRAVGVTGFLVSHWEANRRPVTDLEAVAVALGTTPDAITGDQPVVARQLKTPVSLPVAQPSVEPFLNMTQTQAVISEVLGRKVNAGVVHQWVQGRGFPAYRNPLRRNLKGESTLLFRRSEVLAWLNTQITAVSQ